MRLLSPSAGIFSRFARPLRAAAKLALAVLACLAQGSAQPSFQRVAIPTLEASALAAATDLGPIPASQRLTLTLTLAPTPDRAAALDRFLAALADRTSHSYRQWIAPAQFAAAYGATPGQLAAIAAWAQAQGLAVESISPSAMRVVVSGFPAQVETAFAVSLHQFRLGSATFYANPEAASLPAAIASLVTSIEGLDSLSTGANNPLAIAALAPAIDANATPILTLDATSATGTLTSAQLAAYTLLFRQAAAQGIATLLTRAPTSGGFPSSLPEVTVLTVPGFSSGSSSGTQTSVTARPAWQVAPGLPADGLRHAPDLTASNATALASTLASIALTIPGGRLGNVNPALYAIAATPKLFTQPDAARAGTWEPATGLGLVDLDILAKAFPRAIGGTQSYTGISLSSYSVTYGTPITFTANVTGSGNGPAPTGTVAFNLGNGTTFASVPVQSGTATYTTAPTQLDAATITVQAVYSGDTTYASSLSPIAQVYIGPEKSILAAAVSTGASLGGTYNVNVTDTAGNGVGQPTGNVTLQVQGTQTSLTQPLVTGTGATSSTLFTVPATAVGTLTLQIQCTTTADFSCYTPYTTTVTVAKATPALAISYSPNLPVAGQTITLNATVTGVGSAPTPTGSVTFYDNTTVLNSANLTNGTVTETGIVPNTATHKITATYNGDPNYLPVSSSGTNVPGGTAPTSTSLATSATSVSGGQSFTLSIAVTPKTVVNGVQPTGLVQILDAGAVIATAPALANGTTVYSLSLATAGVHALSAYYPGDANYASSASPTVSVTVASTAGAATTTTVAASSYAVAAGQSVTLTATVTPSSIVGGVQPGGTVTFTASTVGILGTATVAHGVATLTTALAIGSYTIVANYSGDANYASSAGSTSAPITVNGSSGGVALLTATLSADTAVPGSTVNVTALVTLPGSPSPVGSVNASLFITSTAITTTGALVASGTSASTTTIPVVVPNTVGTYPIAITCPVTDSFTCNTVNFTLNSSTTARIPTVTTLTYSPTSPQNGQTVTLTATVTASTTATAAISGTVAFYSGTTLLGTGTIVSGVATTAFPLTATNGQSITAVYSGDTNYATSTSTAINLSAALASVNVSLTAVPANGLSGSSVTLTAQVAGVSASGAAPTGTVSFYLAGASPALLGTAKLGTAGLGTSVATLNASNIPTGAQTVYAVYSGDANFAAGVSPSVSIGLSDYSIALTPASLTLTPGQTGTVVLQVNAAAGFNGTIALGCVPPSNALITCSLSQTSISGAGTSTLTVVTTAPTHAENRRPGAGNSLAPAAGAALAALLCFLLPGRDRRRLPGLLLVLLAMGLIANLGCTSSVFSTPGSSGGTPLGTVNVTLNTAASDGVTAISHDYLIPVTVQ